MYACQTSAGRVPCIAASPADEAACHKGDVRIRNLKTSWDFGSLGLTALVLFFGTYDLDDSFPHL